MKTHFVAKEAAGLLETLGVSPRKYTAGDTEVRSPISGEAIGRVESHNAAEVPGLIAKAHEAFLSWRQVPAPQRGELIRLFAEELRAGKDALARLVTLEAGKIVSEAQGEVQEMIDICVYACGLSRQLAGLTIPSERPRHMMLETWHPLGVVGVISAFNFPVAVWSWNAALALVCGDSVVWKPSPRTPLSALATQSLFERAIGRFGPVPVGLSTILIGGSAIGESLAGNVRVSLLSATGSTSMGRAIAPRVAARLGRALYELGGNNAAIVCPTADLDLTVRAVAFAAMGTAGQRCTTLRRLIVHENIYGALLSALKAPYLSVAIGDPRNENTLIGPLIDARAFEAMQRALSAAVAGGGLLTGGERIEVGDFPDAYYVRPAIVEMPSQTELVKCETFAPILYVMRYSDFAEALALHNDVPQGLSSSIFTRDLREAGRFISTEGSDCGIANVNIGPSGAEIGGAFGGEKETGGGRESGSDAWKNYMRRATNTINYSDDLPLAQGVNFKMDRVDLLSGPRIIIPPPGPNARRIVADDERYISPSYTRSYPLVARRGRGVIVEDVDGNEFLDFSAGIAVASTGHCHPEVVAAIQRQAAELIHMSGTDFYYEHMPALAKRLSQVAPMPGPHRFFYGNSGTEAVECAIKLARYHTRRQHIVAFFGAFHGRTMGALSLTASRPQQRRRFAPLVPGVTHVPYPNTYRAHLTGPDEEHAYALGCARFIEETLFRSTLPPEEVAAIVLEPIQGEGGYVVGPSVFLQEIRRICDRHGILMIVDEVQSGAGRTGRWWAIEHSGVQPDIVVIAKGIASGMPLGICMSRAEIMSWEPGSHGSTFGGNPVSLAAALATVDILEREAIANADAVGRHMRERMRTWPEQHRMVVDVRGRGLMIGIEIDSGSRVPARQACDSIVKLAFERGLLCLGAGESTIRLTPPLIISKEQADIGLNILEDCIRAAEG